MTVEEMLKFLGVRTQSKESIELCYKMDLQAFKMMDDNSLKEERQLYFHCYHNLLDELGYVYLDEESKTAAVEALKDVKLNELDKDYRDHFFTGLERILLRYDRYDLVGYQRIPESSFEGMAKDAYLYELSGEYDKAISYYEKLGFTDRIEKVEAKKARRKK